MTTPRIPFGVPSAVTAATKLERVVIATAVKAKLLNLVIRDTKHHCGFTKIDTGLAED